MKNTTRRNLLKSLGAGAAALAALTVAGTPGSAKAELIPIDPNRTVVVPIQSNSLQVAVQITKEGFVVDAKPSDEPKVGITKDETTLLLGVYFDKDNLAITGLDSVLNRAKEGRCIISDNNVELSRF